MKTPKNMTKKYKAFEAILKKYFVRDGLDFWTYKGCIVATLFTPVICPENANERDQHVETEFRLDEKRIAETKVFVTKYISTNYFTPASLEKAILKFMANVEKVKTKYGIKRFKIV